MKAETPTALPFDTELEQSILGKMLADPRFIDIAAGEIESYHFNDPLHQRVFEMTVHLQGEGEVTPILVASVMRADPAARGGFDLQQYIHSLALSAPAVTRMADLLKQLRELALRRDLVTIGEDLAAGARGDQAEASAQELADRASDALLHAGADKTAVRLTPHEIAQVTIRGLERQKDGVPLPLIRTHLEKLNREVGGFRETDLVIILGKSGMGKSALMASTALHMALDGTPVIYFTPEMSGSQTVERMVCEIDHRTAEKGMWYQKVRNGQLSDEEFERFVLASQHLEGLPLEIDDEDGLTIAQIQARARAFKAKMASRHKNLDGTPKTIAVFIDYIQIVEPMDRRDPREQQVNRTVRGAKSLAKREKCVVIAGSQMNEDDTKGGGKPRRPRANDARESKAIMNEADLMLGPWREAKLVLAERPLGAKPGEAAWNTWHAELVLVQHKFELLGLKNRHGREFEIPLWADMGSNAILDDDPRAPVSEEDQHARDLLEGIV